MVNDNEVEALDELKLLEKWMAEAKTQTPATIGTFIYELVNHPHDYGTICRAIAAAAVGAAYAINNSDSGGITGFQASCVNWDFLAYWGHVKSPARITEYQDLLYPQMAEKFTTISQETWDFIKQKAADNLAEHVAMRAGEAPNAHPNVIAHWQSIIDGVVPFGLKVRK